MKLHRGLHILFFVVLLSALPTETAAQVCKKLDYQVSFDNLITLERSSNVRFVVITPPNPDPPVDVASIGTIKPQTREERIAYAIGRHESANFTACPQGCDASHNYFGRKAASGGYLSFSSDAEAWQNQLDYLDRKFFSKGIYDLHQINKTYAEDNGWADKVSKYL